LVLGEAVFVALDCSLPQVSRGIQKLSTLLQKRLEKEIPSMKIHHQETTTCGIVTFYFENVDAKIKKPWRMKVFN